MIGQRIIEILQEEVARDLSIAFLPYKYSMWDCMESVYLSAQRLGLDTGIIPLDYQIMPEGTWVNESESFPQPTGTFEDLKNSNYDVLVIHYPYDGCNNVTKLHPSQWTEELKQYGKVCYIPYHGNIAGTEWSRFYRMPGARNCDMIVLGSDRDVEVFKNENPKYPGKIIQVSDSPKVDAPFIHMYDTRPLEWRFLKRPVTLIIGTLWTFTHDPVSRIDKHKRIIDQELKAGHSVIYRPHPLVYPAIKVMRPEIKRMYEEFIDQMREDGVILDDKPDLHRTIAVSDKIYTDPSSVIKTIQNLREYEVTNYKQSSTF